MNSDRTHACDGKKRLTKEEAHRIAHRAEEAERVHPYVCPHCHAYHIGHLPTNILSTKARRRELQQARRRDPGAAS